MAEFAVEVEDLVKTFGDFVAVDHIRFQVERGEIFGFLGPNGAGKSTTIRMLCGLLMPTSGKGRVAGFDLMKEPEKIKQVIGYMSQKFSLYDDLTVIENLHFFGGIYGLSGSPQREREEEVLEMIGLAKSSGTESPGRWPSDGNSAWPWGVPFSMSLRSFFWMSRPPGSTRSRGEISGA